MKPTASKPPWLTHHDLTVDQRMLNLFAVAFAGP